MRLRQDYLKEQMQNEEFKASYDEWEPDFAIADALLRFRSDKKLTQAELAKMIGINRSDLSKLESANANPTLKTLKRIAMALGTQLKIRYELSIDADSEKADISKVIEFPGSGNTNDGYGPLGGKYRVNLGFEEESDQYNRQDREIEPSLE